MAHGDQILVRSEARAHAASSQNAHDSPGGGIAPHPWHGADFRGLPLRPSLAALDARVSSMCREHIVWPVSAGCLHATQRPLARCVVSHLLRAAVVMEPTQVHERTRTRAARRRRRGRSWPRGSSQRPSLAIHMRAGRSARMPVFATEDDRLAVQPKHGHEHVSCVGPFGEMGAAGSSACLGCGHCRRRG